MSLTQRHQSLELLSPYSQFVVYATAPRVGKPGKLDKFPIDPLSNSRLSGWNRPDSWLTIDQAFSSALSGHNDRGVGFVVTSEDNLHFLDIDGCVEDGQWAPEALSLLEGFPGAYVEASISGTGLHAIFYATKLPDHASRCVYEGLALELYSSGHFCALTGRCWRPDTQFFDNRVAGQALAQWFPRTRCANEDIVDWADAPILRPRAPKDDAELIRRILNDEY